MKYLLVLALASVCVLPLAAQDTPKPAAWERHNDLRNRAWLGLASRWQVSDRPDSRFSGHR